MVTGYAEVIMCFMESPLSANSEVSIQKPILLTLLQLLDPYPDLFKPDDFLKWM